MEKIRWADRVRHGKVLHRIKEEINILHTVSRRKAKWIRHILRRNSVVKHIIKRKEEGRIELTVSRGRRRKQLMDTLLKERRGKDRIDGQTRKKT